MNSINLASETKVLYNKGVTPKLKCVLILHFTDYFTLFI